VLGERAAQKSLLEADTLCLDFVGRDSYYGFIASLPRQLFRGEAFAGARSERLFH
jgi:hypothetical protein